MADDETAAEPSLAYGPNPALSAQAGVDAAAAAAAKAPKADAKAAAEDDDDEDKPPRHRSAGGKAGGRA